MASDQEDSGVRDEDYVLRDSVFTPKEPWIANRGKFHWYWASTEICRTTLSCFQPGNCLVIGSPLQEVEKLENMGWRVTYMDIRIPPVPLKDFVRADAREIPFPDGTFDAVSSACVMCHVGLGRYGDAISADGDEKMLREVSRVLKPQAPAVITFGPVTKRAKSVRHGNMHRVYSLKDVERMSKAAGFEIQELRIWDAVKHEWTTEADEGFQPSKYVSTVLRHK